MADSFLKRGSTIETKVVHTETKEDLLKDKLIFEQDLSTIQATLDTINAKLALLG